jgi:stearoyl-CoA desaturase (delta-9 desaturase)
VILFFALFGGLPFGWAAFFWFGPMRLVTSLHAQCFVNSIAHMREGRKDGEDSSQNITWLGFLHFFQGENWHENHHAKPSSAKFGWTFWQIDFGWYIIVVLEKIGLAHNVKRPTFRAIEVKKTEEPVGETMADVINDVIHAAQQPVTADA